jgi:hypothetical protein
MRRTIASGAAVIALAVAAALALPALAASLGSNSRTLGAGTASVPRCDADGIKIAINLTGTNVVSVTGTGIDSGCGGLTMKATVTGGTSSSGSIAVPAGGGSVTATLAASVAVVQSLRVDVVVTP